MGTSWESAVEKDLVILQGNLAGMPALADPAQEGRTGASSRGCVLTDTAPAARPRPAAAGEPSAMLGSPPAAFFGSLFYNLSTTFLAEQYGAGGFLRRNCVVAAWTGKGCAENPSHR